MANSIKSHIISILVLPITAIVIIPFLLSYYVKHVSIIETSIYLKLPAIAFLLIGLLLIISTIYLFATIGNGTLAPWSSILIAEALWLNNVVLVMWMILFFILNTIYFIMKEEPDLVKRFGADYINYKKYVPRWIPNLKPYKVN